MRFQRVLMLLCLMMLATGCNLGGGNDETDEPIVIETQDEQSGQPTVRILSPADGDEFVVGEQILFSVEASDSIGVTQVRLSANGQTVKTAPSDTTAGDTDFDAVLDYTPRTTGDFTMSVVAARGIVTSEPAEISITVVDEEADTDNGGSPTQSGPAAPQIPNDGVCRALVDTNLNFRSEPTATRDNIIRVLPTNTLAPIVARLGDNSWWKLNVNGQIGWVSANFTTIYGNCQTVPVENFVVNTAIPTRTPTPTPSRTPTPTLTPTITNTPVPGVPNLIISRFEGEQDVVIPAGDTEVTEEYSVTITNVGAGPTGRFVAVVRFDSNTFNLGVVSDLRPAQSIVFTQEITFDTSHAEDEFVIIRAEADSDDEVAESSEADNLGLLEVTVTLGS